jgi:hypothetical protein
MKSQTQTLLLIIVLVILVGGITFIRNWIHTTSPDPGTGPGPEPPKELMVDFVYTQAPGTHEYEVQTPGHHDFPFRNNSAETVELGLDGKNCRCSEVEALVLTDEDQQHMQHQALSAIAAQVLNAPAGVMAVIGPGAVMNDMGRAFLEQNKRWHVLKKAEKEAEETVVKVPGKASGYVRLGWSGKKAGLEKLIATVWVQAPGDPRSRGGRTELTVPVHIFPPVRVYPEKVQVPDLKPGQTHQFHCYCFSSTRSNFKLTSIKEETDHPCFQCSATRLRGKELEDATDFLRRAEELKTPAPLRVLCAYRIDVVIHERLPNNRGQLDLGPLNRKILITPEIEDHAPLPLTVMGVVRDNVMVGTDENRDRISFKTFDRTKGATATVPVEVSQSGIDIVVDTWEPKYLEVRLEAKKSGALEGGRRWDLHVTVPRNLAAGPLPENSAIILKTQTQPPRYIRVPVRGNATVRQ